MDAGDVDGVGFEVSERELEDAVGDEGVVEGSAIGCDHDDAAAGFFHGTVYACEVEEEALGMLVVFNGWIYLAVGWERKLGMTLTGKHVFEQRT